MPSSALVRSSDGRGPDPELAVHPVGEEGRRRAVHRRRLVEHRLAVGVDDEHGVGLVRADEVRELGAGAEAVLGVVGPHLVAAGRHDEPLAGEAGGEGRRRAARGAAPGDGSGSTSLRSAQPVVMSSSSLAGRSGSWLAVPGAAAVSADGLGCCGLVAHGRAYVRGDTAARGRRDWVRPGRRAGARAGCAAGASSRSARGRWRGRALVGAALVARSRGRSSAAPAYAVGLAVSARCWRRCSWRPTAGCAAPGWSPWGSRPTRSWSRPERRDAGVGAGGRPGRRRSLARPWPRAGPAARAGRRRQPGCARWATWCRCRCRSARRWSAPATCSSPPGSVSWWCSGWGRASPARPRAGAAAPEGAPSCSVASREPPCACSRAPRAARS